MLFFLAVAVAVAWSLVSEMSGPWTLFLNEFTPPVRTIVSNAPAFFFGVLLCRERKYRLMALLGMGLWTAAILARNPDTTQPGEPFSITLGVSGVCLWFFAFWRGALNAPSRVPETVAHATSE